MYNNNISKLSTNQFSGLTENLRLLHLYNQNNLLKIDCCNMCNVQSDGVLIPKPEGNDASLNLECGCDGTTSYTCPPAADGSTTCMYSSCTKYEYYSAAWGLRLSIGTAMSALLAVYIGAVL